MKSFSANQSLHSFYHKVYNLIEMPILDPHTIEYISHSADQTRRAGMRLGSILKKGDLVCLTGELGSGKTTLVQGISAGWGSLDLACSPTFVLVNVYRQPGGNRMYHLDAYRVNSAEEAYELDIDSMTNNGPLIIEWADRILEALPPERLWIQIRWIDQDQRDMLIKAQGAHYRNLLTNFRQRVFGVF